MRNKTCGQAAIAFSTVITCIAIAVKSKRRCIIRYRIVLDVMSLIIQRVSIGFDLCIKGTQVLAGSVVYINVICRAGWIIVVVQCLACYQLVGSRSICGSSGRAFRELFCAKSLAPGVFIVFLLVCCRNGFCNGFSIIADGVGLQISANVRCVRFGIRFQLFHDHGIMGINAVSGFDETVIVSRLIRCIFCSNRILSVIVPRPICIG